MEHSYYQDRLSAYHDNELPLQEKVVVEEHLRECSECRELLAQYEKLDQLVESHGQLADGDYWEKAARKIDRAIAGAQATETEDITPQKRGSLLWKLLPIAASIVIVGYIGFHRDEIFQPGPGTQQTTPEIATRAESIPARGPSGEVRQSNKEALSVPAEKDKQSVSKQLNSAPPNVESGRLQEVRTKTKNEPVLKPSPSAADAGSAHRDRAN
jgi:anti-sigma factor RsiW